MAPSANKSRKPTTNAQDVLQDMDGIIGGVVDGGACDIRWKHHHRYHRDGAVILRPGGITEEMIRGVWRGGTGSGDWCSPDQKPKAPGMKYRHYAPKAPMVLIEGPEAGLG